ncbi:Breast carcinoma amplified sequence 3, partial [Nowakowskiella sp. JEL0078]
SCSVWTVPVDSSEYPTCLHRLERGFTPAIIHNISFSQDGKWIGVSTAKGTTHVYQIHPLKAPLAPTRERPVTLHSVTRLKQSTPSIIDFIYEKTNVSALKPLDHQKNEKKDSFLRLYRQRVLSINSSGSLTFYTIEISYSEPANLPPQSSLISRFPPNKILASQFPALAGASPYTPRSDVVAQFVKITCNEHLEWTLYTPIFQQLKFPNLVLSEPPPSAQKLLSNGSQTQKQELVKVNIPTQHRWISEIELQTFDTTRWNPLSGLVFERYMQSDEEDEESIEADLGEIEKDSGPSPDYSDLPRSKETRVRAKSFVPYGGEDRTGPIFSSLETGKEKSTAKGIAQEMD